MFWSKYQAPLASTKLEADPLVRFYKAFDRLTQSKIYLHGRYPGHFLFRPCKSGACCGHGLTRKSASVQSCDRYRAHSSPPEVSSRVDIPLSCIPASSRRGLDRLVFLDHNEWLCSWRLSLPNDLGRRPSAGKTNTKVSQHSFLPGDWISPDCVALATVMTDGTLLIPRNGEVAIVKCVSVAT